MELSAQFELLEHTADIGFRAFGRTLAELFENAALALVSIAYEVDSVSPECEYALAATGTDYESLLVAWLSEVLYWFDGKRIRFLRFRIDSLGPDGLAALGLGEPLDPLRHQPRLAVKAVTWHQLKIAETPAGWIAEVYLDI